MAGFTKGHAFTEREILTISALHALVDSGTLNNVGRSDVASAIELTNITTPPSPATGNLRIGSDYLGEYYDGAAWSDLSQDTVYLTLTNGGATLVNSFVPVKIKPGSPGSFVMMRDAPESNNQPFAIPIANCAPAASVTCIVRGISRLIINGSYSAGSLAYYEDDSGSTAYQQVIAGSSPNSRAFAVLLSSGGSSGFNTTATAYIFK